MLKLVLVQNFLLWIHFLAVRWGFDSIVALYLGNIRTFFLTLLTQLQPYDMALTQMAVTLSDDEVALSAKDSMHPTYRVSCSTHPCVVNQNFEAYPALLVYQMGQLR